MKAQGRLNLNIVSPLIFIKEDRISSCITRKGHLCMICLAPACFLEEECLWSQTWLVFLVPSCDFESDRGFTYSWLLNDILLNTSAMTVIGLSTGVESFVGLFWTLKGRQVPKSSAIGGCDKCYDEAKGRLFGIREQHLNKLWSGWIFVWSVS